MKKTATAILLALAVAATGSTAMAAPSVAGNTTAAVVQPEGSYSNSFAFSSNMPVGPSMSVSSGGTVNVNFSNVSPSTYSFRVVLTSHNGNSITHYVSNTKRYTDFTNLIAGTYTVHIYNTNSTKYTGNVSLLWY